MLTSSLVQWFSENDIANVTEHANFSWKNDEKPVTLININVFCENQSIQG